jgi:signal transduction histidine kinase/ligand-binding sensor domain-containing protein/DNA-binding response OmpR family regulator
MLLLFLLGAGVEGCCQVNDYFFGRLDIQDGLSDNHVLTVFKDDRGYIWFGTRAGLNRYDGYSFKVFRHNDTDSTSLRDDDVQQIWAGPENKMYISEGPGGVDIYDPLTERFVRDPDGYLKARHLPRYGMVGLVKGRDHDFYFAYADSGVFRFVSGKAAVRVNPGPSDTMKVSGGALTDVALDSMGGLWLSHTGGNVERMDLATGRINVRMDVLEHVKPRPEYGFKLFIDDRNKIWLFAPGYPTGLREFDPLTGALSHFWRDSGRVRLSRDIVNGVIQDNKGLIWIATDQGGINLLDRTGPSMRYLGHSEDGRSLSENTVTTLYRDNTGTIWLGTFKKGISYYQENLLKFPLYRHQPGVAGSLPYDDVTCFAEDGSGNIWIGTNGGGLIYFDRKNSRFSRVQHDAADPASLSNDVVISLAMDHKGRLWVGTYQGGLERYDGRHFVHYRHRDPDPTSLADDRVYAIREDVDGAMWVGTLTGGLDRLDVATGKFYHNKYSMPFSLHSNYVPALAVDSASNLWIGTAYGIDVLQRSTGKFQYFTRAANMLSDDVIYSMICDHKGNMWVGTRKGLSVLQPRKTNFQNFHMKDGLPSNAVMGVLEDREHHLWVSTSGGLSRITVSEVREGLAISCVNYDELDGLQGKEFNERTALRTGEGELLFGGGKGFNLFRPESIGRDEHLPPVVLTGLYLYNKEVPLPISVAADGKLELSYDENNFTLEFAALSYINARKNRYAYQLTGFDKDWTLTDGRNRRATYTNIDPGSYVFRVRASNSDGVWNDRGITVRVIVRPPFWKTWLAYAIYVMLILAVLYFGRLRIIRRARARFALAEERREAMRLHELDRLKIKFFTNLSHEFRTPLSLILSPADKLIRETEEPGRRQLAMTIERNAQRLLHLVNQLLDLRKMEVNELKLNMSRGDIAEFIMGTAGSFSDLAAEKGITLGYRSDLEHLPALFDRDKVQRILFNLLSNALKFTSSGGSVETELAIVEHDERSALLQIRVKDTGIGIPPAAQEKIFESFFQVDVPGHTRNLGTGIGLSITREFVEMHGGTIRVESVPDKGSCFTVLLPVTLVGEALAGVQEAPVGAQEAPVGEGVQLSAREGIDGPGQTGGDEPRAVPTDGKRKIRVLLVDDDDDFRFYLKDNLAPLFTVLEAANGREGWQRTLSLQPDLVVSDVNMPLMDGLELCRRIKEDERVRHIPVILLTALADEQDQLRALGVGVNDYVSKPFNVEILISRINNLLKFKGTVEETLKRRVDIEPSEVEVEPERTEEDFIRDAVAVLEKNISNVDFSVEDWSREMGLSRTTLYKRILAATGKTPIGYIRSFRMKRAAQLLEKTRHNVAEVAYMVGFNNPKYFARYFKETYGRLPSVYQAEKRKG